MLRQIMEQHKWDWENGGGLGLGKQGSQIDAIDNDAVVDTMRRFAQRTRRWTPQIDLQWQANAPNQLPEGEIFEEVDSADNDVTIAGSFW